MSEKPERGSAIVLSGPPGACGPGPRPVAIGAPTDRPGDGLVAGCAAACVDAPTVSAVVGQAIPAVPDGGLLARGSAGRRSRRLAQEGTSRLNVATGSGALVGAALDPRQIGAHRRLRTVARPLGVLQVALAMDSRVAVGSLITPPVSLGTTPIATLQPKVAA